MHRPFSGAVHCEAFRYASLSGYSHYERYYRAMADYCEDVHYYECFLHMVPWLRWLNEHGAAWRLVADLDKPLLDPEGGVPMCPVPVCQVCFHLEIEDPALAVLFKLTFG